MAHSRSKVEAHLTASLRDGVPITVRRKGQFLFDVDGFVVALANEWVVLHQLLEHVYLDDVVILRLDQIKKAERHPNEAYVARSVEALGVPVARFECGAGAGTADLLSTVADRHEVIAVSYLDDGYRWTEFGLVQTVGDEKFKFHHIEPDGVWAKEPGLRTVKDLTSIRFGGLHLIALNRFGDESPTP